MKRLLIIALVSFSVLVFFSYCQKATQGTRWTEEEINQWYAQQEWPVGMNYNPRTAINQIEMWQAESFDPKTIDQELGWAEELGFNTARVYLHNLVYQNDPEGYIKRIEKFLTIADKHGIRPMFVFFDAVWNPESSLGDQPDPKPRVHNSGWVQCPNKENLKDTSNYDQLKKYVQGIASHFATDERVLIWDVYNEPGNMNGGRFDELENKNDYVFRLLKKSFKWMREVNPSQPITSGVWEGDWSDTNDLSRFNEFMLNNSDIISFHGYDNPERFKQKVEWLEVYDRPKVCTEYMARKTGNTFENILPILNENNIGAYNWGFVSGKTQTIYPWDSWNKNYMQEPDPWFHDILRKDGTPYDSSEVRLIKRLTGAN